MGTNHLSADSWQAESWNGNFDEFVSVIPAKAEIQDVVPGFWMPAPGRTWNKVRGHDGELSLRIKLTER